jgi:peptide/nickel transport system substrate-binding protein
MTGSSGEEFAMKFKLSYLPVFVLSLLLSACVGASPTPAETPDADTFVLRVGALNDDYRLESKDPGRVTVGMISVNANIFDTLTRMDADFQVLPMLAESWEYVEESEAWHFHLRQGITFHDGQPFTAQAVVETMNRITLSDSYAGILKIDQNSAVAVDDYTVEIRSTTPNLQLPGQMAHPIFGIRAPGSDPFQGEHIGTGPFKFVEYVSGDHITVEKNPNYWGAVPRVDRIEFRFMPDPNTRVVALQAQEVDIIYSVPLEVAEPLSDVSDIRLLPSNVGAYQGLSVLLTGKEPYDITQDVLVREAIGYAIDRREIIEVAFGGFATASQTLIPASVLGSDADKVKGYTHDPERARALLEEAGWRDADGNGIREKDGRELSLELIAGYPTETANRGTSKVIQAQLLQVGIDLRITSVSNKLAYEDLLTGKRGDLWLEIGNQNSASPCFLPGFLYYGNDANPNIWQSAFAPGPAGWPAFDDEIDKCNTTSSSAEAALHAANALHILIDQARAVIPLVGLYHIWFTSDDVQNFGPHPIFVMVRWDTVSLAR